MDDKNKDDIRKRLEELRKENNRKNGGNDGGRSPFFGSAFVFIMIIALFFCIRILYTGCTKLFSGKERCSIYRICS